MYSKQIIALTAALAAASPVTAQDSTDDPRIREARARFQVAEAQFERRHYALAADTFREAYDLMEGHPRRYLVLYNIGRCLEETGAYRQAANAYRRYLAEGGEANENAAEVRDRVREMERRAAVTGDQGPRPAQSTPAQPSPSGPDDALLAGAITSYCPAPARTRLPEDRVS